MRRRKVNQTNEDVLARDLSPLRFPSPRHQAEESVRILIRERKNRKGKSPVRRPIRDSLYSWSPACSGRHAHVIAFAITADSAWPLPRQCHTGGGVNWQIDAQARVSSNNLETHFYPSFFFFFRFRNFLVPRFGAEGWWGGRVEPALFIPAHAVLARLMGFRACWERGKPRVLRQSACQRVASSPAEPSTDASFGIIAPGAADATTAAAAADCAHRLNKGISDQPLRTGFRFFFPFFLCR